MKEHYETEILVVGAGPVGIFTVFAAGMLDMSCHVVRGAVSRQEYLRRAGHTCGHRARLGQWSHGPVQALQPGIPYR
jgi:threonine dehydrogenase-like Zn-dependent dehydrogenase